MAAPVLAEPAGPDRMVLWQQACTPTRVATAATAGGGRTARPHLGDARVPTADAWRSFVDESAAPQTAGVHHDGMRVLGADVCPGGWVGIALAGSRVQAYLDPTIGGLVAQAVTEGPLAIVGIDMPIGLPDAGPRQADTLAKEAVGPRRSSVFLTPPRPALGEPTHAEAVATSRRLTGAGSSIQAYGLRHTIAQVEDWLREDLRVRDGQCRRAGVTVVEVHPEVSFAALNGAPLSTRKSTWAGARQRQALLAAAGIVLPDDLGAAGSRAGVDDVLDAAAVAWTAARVAAGQARCLPDPPEPGGDGLPAAIWT